MNNLLTRSAFVQLQRRGELDLLAIRHPAFQADLLLQGAQLLSFAPSGESDWLWLSEQARYQRGQSVRGGIPVCWPWFGAPLKNPPQVQQHLQHGAAAAAHGFARTLNWQLTALHEACDHLRLTLSLPASVQPHWQGRLTAGLTFELSAHTLTLTLTTRNDDQQPLSFTQALHTYLPTADIHHTRLHGLHQQPYVDTLRDWQTCIQTGDVRFDGETDRIYTSSGTLTLISPGQRRTLCASGSRSTVVWNPWIAKSTRLSQFASTAWQRMLCVETANALDDAITLAAGASHSLSLTLSR